MKKVLIVDDSSYMRMFVKKIIEKSGLYVTLEASTKADAIGIFKNENPDIVTIDLNMSELRMDGVSVLNEILEINPDVVAIIISAVGYEHVKDECMELGANNYLKKPFCAKELLDILEGYK